MQPLKVNSLNIDIFPKEVLPIAGTIGMTKFPNIKDLDILKNEYKTDILISLMQDYEYDYLGISDIREKCVEKSIVNIRFQIADGSIPSDKKLPEFVKLAKNIKKESEDGKNIVIHCMGGRGRTGTLVACLLVLFGFSPEDAIATTRKYRKGAIETRLQEELVKEFGKLAEEDEKKIG